MADFICIKISKIQSDLQSQARFHIFYTLWRNWTNNLQSWLKDDKLEQKSDVILKRINKIKYKA